MLLETCKMCDGKKQFPRESDGMMIQCPACHGVGWHYLVRGIYPFVVASIGLYYVEQSV